MTITEKCIFTDVIKIEPRSVVTKPLAKPEMDARRAQRAFLVSCSESLILQNGHGTTAGRQSTSLEEVVMVTLNSFMLKTLDQLAFCRELRVCILADNFLTRIDPLIECVHLVKLDLRGNQIVHLPSSSFWSNLKDLQLLHLHDNNMATKKNVAVLSGCPNLSALTLYDTPLSLKASYRHCVINSIWSLKALDNHVISDEEIMENWRLPLKFKAKAPHFGVNLYPQLKPVSYKTEIKVVYGIIAEVNRIQANYSPILIIQKWIRGHLARRSLGLRQALRPWQTTIQTSPYSPGTTSRSWMEHFHADQLQQGKKEGYSVVKKLHVNLSKLVQPDYQTPPDAVSVRSFDSTKLKNLNVPCNTPQQCTLLNRRGSTLDEDVLDDLHNEVMDSDAFCLSGRKATIHLFEPLAEMLMSRKADGQDVRNAVGHFHKQKPRSPYRQQPRPPQPRPRNTTAEERLIGQCYECLSLAPFRVIEKAYRAREKAEDLKGRVERVEQAQALRAEARGRRDDFMTARRKEALERREQERTEMEEALNLLGAQRELEVQRVQQRYARLREERRRRLSEREMVERFSRQHLSLAAAVARQCVRHNLRLAQCERRRRLATCRLQTVASETVEQTHLDNRGEHTQAEGTTSRLALCSPRFSKSALLDPKSHGPRGACEAQPGARRTVLRRSARPLTLSPLLNAVVHLQCG